jgi:hypothetical protein
MNEIKKNIGTQKWCMYILHPQFSRKLHLVLS